MKPKDLIHAMNEIEPALIEQAMNEDLSADNAGMSFAETAPAERTHPAFRIIGTLASLAACAVIVTAGVLWIHRAGKPDVIPAASSGEAPTTRLQTVQDASAPAEENTAAQTGKSQTGESVTGPTDGASGSDGTAVGTAPADAGLTGSTGSSATESGRTAGNITTGTTTETVQDTKQTTTMTLLSVGSVLKEQTELVTEPVREDTQSLCRVEPKIWKTSWYQDASWAFGQPNAGGFVIHSTKQMMERNAEDDCTYVYEHSGFANDAFFADYDLIVCALQSGTGSIEAGVRRLTYVTGHDPNGTEKRWVDLDLADYVPECVTCDMCTVCIAIPVPKGLLPADLYTVHTFVTHYKTEFRDDGSPIRDPDPYALYQAALPRDLMLTRAEAHID